LETTFVKIEDNETEVERYQIVNYWNDGDEVKILVRDESGDKTLVKLEAKANLLGRTKGKVVTTNKTYKIACTPCLENVYEASEIITELNNCLRISSS
jgi:hypothetical protein